MQMKIYQSRVLPLYEPRRNPTVLAAQGKMFLKMLCNDNLNNNTNTST